MQLAQESWMKKETQGPPESNTQFKKPARKGAKGGRPKRQHQEKIKVVAQSSCGKNRPHKSVRGSKGGGRRPIDGVFAKRF